MNWKPGLFAALLVAQSASAAELTSLQLPARVSLGYGTNVGEAVHSYLELAPSAEASLSSGVRMSLSARVRLDRENQLEPGRATRDTWSGLSKPYIINDLGTVELRDVYLEFELESGIARIGKQQIVWGRLDGIKVLDVLNPQSYREFILEDVGYSRIGLWSAYVDRTFRDWRMELAVIPDQTGHEIPAEGAWFELTAPRFRYGASPGQSAPPMRTVRDQNSLDATAIGLQVSRSFGSVGMSGMVYSGLEHEPLGRIAIDGGMPVLERFYERRNLLGVNADTAIGPVVLRTEFALQPGRMFNTRSTSGLETIRLDQATLALAADYMAPLGMFINLQLLIDNVSNAPPTLVRPDQDRIATAVLRKSFNYETVNLEMRIYSSLKDGDRLLSAAVRYEPVADSEWQLRIESFGGDRNGLFGQFRDRDRLILEFSHYF